MSETHANQSLLVAIGLYERQLILGVIGDKAKQHVANSYDPRSSDLIDLGFFKDDLPATEPGIYVWEGTLTIACYSDDDAEHEWDGTWRAVQTDDFEKFGLSKPIHYTEYQSYL